MKRGEVRRRGPRVRRRCRCGTCRSARPGPSGDHGSTPEAERRGRRQRPRARRRAGAASTPPASTTSGARPGTADCSVTARRGLPAGVVGDRRRTAPGRWRPPASSADSVSSSGRRRTRCAPARGRRGRCRAAAATSSSRVEQRPARRVDDALAAYAGRCPPWWQMTTSSRATVRAEQPADQRLGVAVAVAGRRVEQRAAGLDEGSSWSPASCSSVSRPQVIVPRASRVTFRPDGPACAAPWPRTLVGVTCRHAAASGHAVGERPVACDACGLGVNLGYWGAGNDGDNLAARPGGRPARLRSRLGGRGLRLGRRRPCSPGSAAQTERIDLGCGRLADPGAHPGDDGDDRGDARHAVRRPVPARARRLRARR